jgi:hypothetical protein
MVSKQIIWSDLPTKNFLCNRGESLAQEEWKLRSNYSVMRCGLHEWKVLISVTATTEGPIPVFRRIRRVAMRPDGRLFCSCCLFERHGHGCRHILSVIQSEVPDYLGFVVEDVSVHWWATYYHFGERPKEHLELSTILELLHKKDIDGPLLPHFQEIVDCWVAPQPEELLHPQFMEKPCYELLDNCTSEHVQATLQKFSRSTIRLHHSQTSVNCSSDIEVDGDDDGLDCGGDDDLMTHAADPLDSTKPHADAGSDTC